MAFKADYEFAWSKKIFEKLWGDNNYGLAILKDNKGFARVVKPELFAMNFVNNPKNNLYVKAS